MQVKSLLILAAFAALLCLLYAPAQAERLNGVEIKQGQWKGQNVEYLDREILIGLKAGKTQTMFEQELVSYPMEIVRPADERGFMKVKVAEGVDLFAAIDLIEKLPSVRYAEPNMVDRLLVIPNDPLFNTQWHYHNIGQNPPGGTVDADIDCPEGWDISTGDDTIIVGVLDSGIPIQGGSLSHPDLDDPNRYIIGTSVIDGGLPIDDNGHGTHVSGTIAAESNNGIGVAGVAWNVKVMAIKVFNYAGSGSHEYFRDGCFYGVNHGCKVLNYSGGGSAGATKEWGVAYADSNNVVIAAAAGNNWQGSVDYPGAYSLQYDNLICVSATNHYDQSSPFSSIGAAVTVAAPGGQGSPYDADDIQSTFPNYPCYLTNNYGLPLNYSPLAGTSMATPHVAGFAALILSMNPGLTPDSVREIMKNTADDLGPAGFDNQFGYGRINVRNALEQMGAIMISHTPLTDTRDTLNDYEVLAKIWSLVDLVDDSLLLYYQVNSVWYQDTMVATGTPDFYHGYIPAQSPGTTISYYIYARNVDGDADTTDTYVFTVIDYGVALSPDNQTQFAPVDDTVWYQMKVVNEGVYGDQYSLACLNAVWETTLWDQAQASQITGTPAMSSGDSLIFYVRVLVPASLEGELDSIALVATSLAQSAVSDTSILVTVSTGQPWEIPFSELFPTTTFDITKWESTAGTQINDVGLDEPSPLYSANFNGSPNSGDELVTEMINLKDQTNVIVKYFYQQTGGGESPDAGDDLIVEYLGTDSAWHELQRHLGSDPDMTEYEEMEIQLPAEALHAGFRLKIHNTATSGNYDDWFVDDIYVGHPSDYAVKMGPSFQSEYAVAGDSAIYGLRIINKGFQADNFALSYNGAWQVVFFNETGTMQISETGVIAGGDSIDLVAKVAVPDGTPLHALGNNTVFATSQGDPDISAYALLETRSLGTPAPIPWYEIMPYDTLYSQRWFKSVGIAVASTAPGTPTPPYSLNLDGGKDTAITQLVNLSDLSDVWLSYYYERGGNADLPETGDNLWVEYLSSLGVWQLLNTHLGGGAAMEDFEYVALPLPGDALHKGLQVRFRSFGESAGADNWYIDNIRIDYAPSVAAVPQSFNLSLVQGDSSEAQLIISNSGQGNLFYDLSINPHSTGDKADGLSGLSNGQSPHRNHPEWVYTADAHKGEELGYQAPPPETNSGGPDDYGYYWLSSDDPGGPIFQWIDIVSTGTDIISQLDDDSYVGPIDIGFNFPFYGKAYDQIYIGSNGIVGFGAEGMIARLSRPIPDANLPNMILAWLWDDLNPDDADNPGAHVYYLSDGKQFVIQFNNYPEYRADPGDVVTAEVIIRDDGSMKFQYKTIAAGFDLLNCSVGIEDEYGMDGLEVVYHAAYLHDNLAIEIFKPFDWLVPDQYSGEILGGQSDTIQCRFITTAELEPGLYNSDLVINHNDPSQAALFINAQLEVLEDKPYICGDANADGLVDVSDAVYIVNYVFIDGSPAPDPYESGDVNCDELVDVSDAVYIVNYIFVPGAPGPCAECP